MNLILVWEGTDKLGILFVSILLIGLMLTGAYFTWRALPAQVPAPG